MPKAVAVETVCVICDSLDHATNMCPGLPMLKGVIREPEEVNAVGGSNFQGYTYQSHNPAWRNHPNFSWKQQGQPQHNQPPPQSQQLHQNPNAYRPPMFSNFQNQQGGGFQKKESMETQFASVNASLQQILQFQSNQGQQFAQMQQFQTFQQNQNLQVNEALARINAQLDKGKLPAQTLPNPNVTMPPPFGGNTKQCQAVTTLRSGRVYQNVEAPVEDEAQKEREVVEEEPVEVEQQDVRVEDMASSSKRVTFKEPATTSTPAPFPQRLFPPTKDRYQAEIREIFQRCQINIPLLDAINQIPTYAKFLKELCMVKRRLNVKKKAFLTEQVSSIVQRNTPTKLRDPGSPHDCMHHRDPTHTTSLT